MNKGNELVNIVKESIKNIENKQELVETRNNIEDAFRLEINSRRDYENELKEITCNEDWVRYLGVLIGLDSSDRDYLYSDLQNLRADEWIEVFENSGVNEVVVNKYKEFFNIENDED